MLSQRCRNRSSCSCGISIAFFPRIWTRSEAGDVGKVDRERGCTIRGDKTDHGSRADFAGPVWIQLVRDGRRFTSRREVSGGDPEGVLVN